MLIPLNYQALQSGRGVVVAWGNVTSYKVGIEDRQAAPTKCIIF
jgi:hypothetical protein